MGCLTARCCSIAALIIGIVLIAIGTGIVVYLPIKIQQKVTLKEGSESTGMWKNPPAEILYHVYPFNLENPEMFLNPPTPLPKMVYKAKGPYVFSQTRRKDNVTFLQNDNVVEFKEMSHLEFKPKLSRGLLNDSLDFLDIIYTIAGGAAIYAKGTKVAVIENFMKRYLKRGSAEEVHMNLTVGDLLQGYAVAHTSKIMGLANRLAGTPDKPETTGLFNTKHGYYGPVTQVKTGADDINNIKLVYSINGATDIGIYQDPECNTFKGSLGSGWHPSLSEDEVLYMYSPDTCRNVPLLFEKKVPYKGMNLFRYNGDKKLYSHSQSKTCYCPQYTGEDERSCRAQDDGTLHLIDCKKGTSAVVMTAPMFKGVDKFYTKNVDVSGPTPEDEGIETFIDIEPGTGAPIRLSQVVQINFMVNKANVNPWIAMPEGERRLIPAAWMHVTMHLNDDVVEKMSAQLGMADVAVVVAYVLIVVGIIHIIIAVVMCFLHRRTKDHKDYQGVRMEVKA